jgi:ABC-type sugar transport system substrate-binding protein
MPSKRIYLGLFVAGRNTILALVVLLLTACNGIFSGPVNNTPIKAASTIHIGFVTETASQNFASEMADGARYAANQYHIKADILAPPTVDDAAALRIFQHMMQVDRDGIGVETLAPNLFVPLEADAVQQRIPIIAVDTTPPPASHITTYIGNDNVEAGVMLAAAAINLLPGIAYGNVLLGVDTPGVPVLDYRAQGIKQQFQKLRPGLHIIGPFNSAQLPQQNYQSWNEMMQTHTDIVAGLGVGDPDNASLAQIKQADHSTYLTGAFDLNEAGLQAVANGTNFALVDPEHFLKGYVAMRLLIEHALYGTAIPIGWWNTGALLVTQSNVQNIISRQVSQVAKGQFYQPIIDNQFANPAAQMKPLDQAK